MQLVKTSEAFKPGLPYTVYLKVSYQDDTPVQDDLNLVSIKWGFGTDPANYNNTEYPIPADGIVEMKFQPPSQGDLLGIEATYKELVQWFSTVPVARSQSGKFIQAVLRTKNPQVGENLRIGVVSTHPLSQLNYAIFGRGKLIFANTIKAIEAETYNEINFRANAEVAPQCRVIVYAIENGEVLADAIDFDVEGTLTNYVEIFASRRTTLPGKDVTVNVKTQPNSFVGLMAVEKSVSAFTPGHDITMSDVVNELRGYDSAKDPEFYPWFRVIRPLRGQLFWHTGSSGSQKVFAESGTIIMTNAHVQPGRRDSNGVTVQHHGENRPLGRPLPNPDDNILTPDQGPGLVYETATRPYLAGPYAFSFLPEPVDNKPKFYLQNDLPDTWLFINATTDLDGKASIPVKAPELANSSWTINGFSLDELYGMGITQEAGHLGIFQPFYVKVELPHSVLRGETLAIQMVVYNYLTREITAEVTLENTEDSAFLFGKRSVNEIEGSQQDLDIELFQTKQVQIKPGRGTLLQFLITPLKIGLLDLKITAKSSVGQDILIKTLRVEAEGQVITVNRPVFLDMRSTTSMERNVTIAIPKQAVPDSVKVFLTAAADPLGVVMNNLADLSEGLPQGGGVQNLMRLIPPAIIGSYLEETERFTGEIASTAIKLMENGYQRQLSYRLSDGSFTSFGPDFDRRGSVWVTAMTVSAFRQAQPFIDVGESVINAANDWLIKSQKPDGSFEETGTIVNDRVQSQALSTTAFVVISLVENKLTLDTNLRNTLNRAINYLAENFDNIQDDDTYTLALCTYAFFRAFHPNKDEGLRKLDAVSKTTKDGLKYWTNGQTTKEEQEQNPWTQQPNSANIEITAYALLCHFLSDETGRDFDEKIPIVEWLLSQQTSSGRFASTTDTYVALVALSEFSRKLRIVDRASAINLQYSFEQTVRRLEINAEASTLLQKRILLPETRTIQLRASGGGVGLVQIGYQFNVAVNGAWPSFVVNPLVFKATSPNQLKLSVCTHYIYEGEAKNSNLAVMEVNLPSGFTIDKDSLPALRRFKNIKRVDPAKGDTKVVLYFESIGRSEICPTISAYRTHQVANQKPAYVLVYDYYDQSRRARSFYQIDPSTLCDICDDCYINDCGSDKPTYLNYESYQFGANVDFHNDATRLKGLWGKLTLTFLLCIMFW